MSQNRNSAKEKQNKIMDDLLEDKTVRLNSLIQEVSHIKKHLEKYEFSEEQKKSFFYNDRKQILAVLHHLIDRVSRSNHGQK